MRRTSGARAFFQSELPRDFPKGSCHGIVDVAVADAERAMRLLRALDGVFIVTETPVMRVIENAETGKREEQHTWSRLSVRGRAETDRELRRLVTVALKRAGIEGWLEG